MIYFTFQHTFLGHGQNWHWPRDELSSGGGNPGAISLAETIQDQESELDPSWPESTNN